MKKLMLSVLFMAFALAVQAGDAKTSKDAKDASPCCSAKTSTVAKTACTMGDIEKTAACGACKDAPSRHVLLSPKAAAEMARK